jgi:hypothetical protein
MLKKKHDMRQISKNQTFSFKWMLFSPISSICILWKFVLKQKFKSYKILSQPNSQYMHTLKVCPWIFFLKLLNNLKYLAIKKFCCTCDNQLGFTSLGPRTAHNIWCGLYFLNRTKSLFPLVIALRTCFLIPSSSMTHCHMNYYILIRNSFSSICHREGQIIMLIHL